MLLAICKLIITGQVVWSTDKYLPQISTRIKNLKVVSEAIENYSALASGKTRGIKSPHSHSRTCTHPIVPSKRSPHLLTDEYLRFSRFKKENSEAYNLHFSNFFCLFCLFSCRVKLQLPTVVSDLNVTLHWLFFTLHFPTIFNRFIYQIIYWHLNHYLQ